MRHLPDDGSGAWGRRAALPRRSVALGRRHYQAPRFNGRVAAPEDAAAGDSAASTTDSADDSSSLSLDQCVESLYLETEDKLEAAGRIASLLSADIHGNDTDAGTLHG